MFGKRGFLISKITPIFLILIFVFILSSSFVYAQENQDGSLLGNVVRIGGAALGASLGTVVPAAPALVPTATNVAVQSSKEIVGSIENGVVAWAVHVLTGVVTYVGNFALALSGGLFNGAMELTVRDIGNTYESVFEGPIVEIWKIFRDIGNILIVFSLLYLAIQIIIQGDGFSQRKTVGLILIAAVLINFSLFFTKVVFDVSNYASVAIYDSIGNVDSQGGVAALLGAKFQLPSLSGPNTSTALIQAIFSFVLTITISVVFLMATMFLVIRLVVFVFLLATSALGLTAKFIPFLKGLDKWWWSELWKQAIALPVFLVLMLAALTFVTSAMNQVGSDIYSALFAQNGLTTAAYQSMKNLTYLVFSLGMLVMAVYLPGKIGGMGSEKLAGTSKFFQTSAKNFGNWTKRKTVGGAVGGAALVGRSTVGWSGRKVTQSETLKSAARTNGIRGKLARTALRGADKVGNQYSYDPRNIKVGKKTIGASLNIGEGIKGYKKTVEEKQKNLDKNKKAEMGLFGFDKLKGDPQKISDAQYEKTKIQDTIKREEGILKSMRKRGANESDILAQTSKVNESKEKLSKANLDLQKLEKQGEKLYLETKNSGMEKWINRIKLDFTMNAALDNFKEKAEKDWIKGKDKKLVEDLKKAIEVDDKKSGSDSNSDSKST